MNREEIVRLHERVLYPVVRVRTEKAGGSGTIVYSAPVPDSDKEYETYILTCHHVIESLIKVDKDAWDPVLKKKRPKEVTGQAAVEVFDYKYVSEVDSSQSYRADVVAYSSHQGGRDLALLKLATPRRMPYVAQLFTGDPRDILCFEEMYVSGCSLLHDPFASKGEITYKTEDIENHLYLMANAPSIFGNSGGAAFRAADLTQIGVTARVTAIQLGFGVDVMTWMQFSVHPQEIGEFLQEQYLRFITDPTVTSAACFAERQELVDRARLAELGE